MRRGVWLTVGLLVTGLGCSADFDSPGSAGEDWGNQAGEGEWDEGDWNQNQDSNQAGANQDFEPEEEEFLVRQTASTDSHVFVPNQADESETVALIDGRDFSVRPIRVGREPSVVVAAEVEDQGSVGYVLSTGAATVAIIRADFHHAEQGYDVRLVPVPQEVNQLAVSPDGRHLLAYIDPDLPINTAASAVSLQSMALVRLGEEPGLDEVFQLSVTRMIDDVAFTADGSQAFVVGQEGIHRLMLEDIKADAFLPALNLGLSASVFPPVDREVAFSEDGSVLVVRTSQYAGVGLFELDPEGSQVLTQTLVELAGVPTDIDLVERDGEAPLLVASLRQEEQVVLIDLEEALASEGEGQDYMRVLEAPGVATGIGRLTPDGEQMILFSTLPLVPVVGLLDLETEEITTFEMRNQVRNLAVSPDSRTAVVVHRRQEAPQGAGGDWDEQFRNSEGITIWDLNTGYRRPVLLQAEPEEIIMTTDDTGHPYLYVMLTSSNPNFQGVKRVDLLTHRTDFVRLPRPPTGLGQVGDRVFVNQDQSTGRITFFEIRTNEQRTVSGFELNAGIQ